MSEEFIPIKEYEDDDSLLTAVEKLKHRIDKVHLTPSPNAQYEYGTPFWEAAKNKINNLYLFIDKHKESITLTDSILNDFNIPKLISDISDSKNYIKALPDISACISLCDRLMLELQDNIGSKQMKSLDEKIIQLNGIYEEQVTNKDNSDDMVKQIEAILNHMNNVKTEHALRGFNILYKEESHLQNRESQKWFDYARNSAILLLSSITICFIFNFLCSITNLALIANEVTLNLVLLSITLWCAKMYSTTRALSINYSHKSLSSSALLPFIDAIKEDEKTKNTILLEASRMIFSPPETGLTNKSDKLNAKLLETIRDINPVLKNSTGTQTGTGR